MSKRQLLVVQWSDAAHHTGSHDQEQGLDGPMSPGGTVTKAVVDISHLLDGNAPGE